MPLGEEARAAVEALVAGVVEDPRAAAAGRLRWVLGEQLHLTIRFLGATPRERAADAAAAASAAAAPQGPFEVRLAGAGGFPSGPRPRVVWLGLASGVPELTALAARLENELVARGWPREGRAFRPHLTIARADGIPGAGRAVDALADAAATLDAAWTADRLVVYRSELGRGPARYVPLAVAPLGGGSLPDEARLR